jgi:hypothetical protein
MSRLFAVIALCFCLILTGCYEIVQRIAVRADHLVNYSAEIRLTPSFFQIVKERKFPDIPTTDSLRAKLSTEFRQRMQVFDTSSFVDESLISINQVDSHTVVKVDLVLGKLKYLHKVNRLFWNGVVSKPTINSPAFPLDINISMKGDSLPVIELAPVAAKYQKVYGIESIDIENVDYYADLFTNLLCTFSFTAPDFLKFEGIRAAKIENGAEWQFPSQDLLLYGRTSFMPVTCYINYPYGVMSVEAEDKPVEK